MQSRAPATTFSLHDAAATPPLTERPEPRLRVPRKAGPGELNVRRVAKWLGAAALALPAAASVDLVQNYGDGRIRITADPEATRGFAKWRPMPGLANKLELVAARAMLAEPPCLAARLAEAEHAWPDVGNFSLAFVPGLVEIATSDVSAATFACIASRVSAAAKAQAQTKDDSDGAFFVGIVLAVLLFGVYGSSPRRAAPANAPSATPARSNASGTASAAVPASEPPAMPPLAQDEQESTELTTLLPPAEATPYAAPPGYSAVRESASPPLAAETPAAAPRPAEAPETA